MRELTTMRGLLSDPVTTMVPAALHGLLDGRRALANARAASTELARRRVEREEVALFLAALPKAGRTRDTA
jgi:hypothetical protein